MTSRSRIWGVLLGAALLAGAVALLRPRDRSDRSAGPGTPTSPAAGLPTSAPRLGKDPGPLLARREGVLKERAGRIGYNSRAYGTTLSDGAIEFSTGIAFKGLGQPRLTYALEDLRVGDRVLAKGGSVRPRAEGRTVSFDRGTVTEKYIFEKEALEQVFVVSSLPEGRGEIRVSGRVATNLAPPAEGIEAEKLSFTWRGVELLSVSKALAIDAEGKKLSLELAWADGKMSMTVPSGWVEEATLPIVIDPLIGGPIMVENQITEFVDQVNSLFVRISDVAWNSASGEWLVIWDEQFGGSPFDYNVLGQRVSATGSTVGAELEIGVTTGGDYEPTISYFPAQNRYLVAWRHDPADNALDTDQRIEGRIIAADGTFVTGQFTIDDPVGQDFAPSVAQDGANWFVVWTNALTSADTNVKGRFVSAAGAPGTGADPDLDLDAAARPSLDFLGSTYLIAWEKGPPLGTRSIVARTMDAAGAFGTAITTVSQSVNDSDHADVSTGTGKFLIVWEEKPAASSYDIVGRMADPALVFQGNAFSITAGFTDQLTPRAAYSQTSDLWYVVFADPVTGAQDIYGVRVSGTGSVFAPDRLTTDGLVDRRPEIAWANSSNEMLVTYLFKTNDPYQLRARRVSMDYDAPSTPGQPVGTPNPNNTGSHLVTWTASTDTGSGLANYELERSLNGGAFTLIASPTTNSFQENALPEGSYVYRVRARDAVGNLSAYSPDSVPVIVDQTAPAAPATLGQFESDGTTPIPIGASAASSTVVLKATIADQGTTTTPVKLQVEVKPVATPFDGTGLAESAFQAGGEASVAVGPLGNGSYHWQARTVDQAGNAGAFASFGGNAETEADLVIGAQPPPAPANFAGVALSTSSLQWSWTDVVGETSYEVHDAGHVVVGTVGADVTTFVEMGLSENTVYTRHVHALNGAGSSAASNSAAVYTKVHDPLAGDFSVMAVSSSQIDVTVVPPPNSTAASTGCEIDRSPDGVGAWITIKPFSNVYSASDMGLSANTTYYYRLRYRNGDAVVTAYSPVKSATTPPAPQPPAAPVITTPNNKKTNDTTPIITGTSEPDVTIKVFFNGIEDGTTLANGSGTWTYHNFAAPKADATYTITAKASNANGDSASSNAISLTVDTAVNPPSGVTLQAFDGQIHVNWSASPDADVIGYEVWRSTAGGGYVKIHTGLVVGTFYCDSGLTNGTQYCYQVRAVDNTAQEAH